MLLTPPPFPPVGGTSLINELSNLGLLTNLKLCLDAGDVNSYDGTSQTWKDLSGNGYDFYRGSTSSAQASDPTFNGTAGRESSGEYFSYDGGDYFTLGQSNPAWVDGIHKNNAIFTLAQWVYANNIDSTAKNCGATGTCGPTSSGFSFGNSSTVGSGLNFGFTVFNGASGVCSIDSTGAANNNAWNFIAITLNEATGAGVFQINASQQTLTGKTYTSPTAGAAGFALQIGAIGNATNPETSGNRGTKMVMWDRSLSAIELAALFNATKSKYGL